MRDGKPSVGVLALGVIAFLVLLMDVLLIFVMLFAIWRSSDERFLDVVGVTGFLLVMLAFGLACGSGIVYRSFGA